MQSKQCMLMILDGWGIREDQHGNAVRQARTPFLDYLLRTYPSTTLSCSGHSVGLPQGVMGNSEVGHLNIGAGRIVYQDLLKIDKGIEDGSFYKNPVLINVMEKTKSIGSSLHLMGLISDGGVHSHLNHLIALLKLAASMKLERVFIHAIMDGRDTSPHGGKNYISVIQNACREYGTGSIATIVGRYFAMDRDKRWDRVKRAYELMVYGEGRQEKDPADAVQNAYDRGETDEFIEPIAIHDRDGLPAGILKNGDGMIFFNFRADRAREITTALTQNSFDGFKREEKPVFCDYVCMTEYDHKFSFPVVYPRAPLKGILGEVISSRNLKQLRIAETEKYAHVTYFFNGGEETPFPLEERCLIPSPKDVATYDLKPEMSAIEVTNEVIRRIKSDTYHLIILNFANMDMVGHTGVISAAIKACEMVDHCVEQITREVLTIGGSLLITADHGNSETMIDDDGNPYTAHTTNPVHFILVDEKRKGSTLKKGILGDIAPTILDIMEIPPSPEMTGATLICKA